MRIPIYISRIPRAQPLQQVQMPCPFCHQTTVQHVIRHYMSVHVYLLPMVSAGTQYEYRCASCGGSRAGPAPVGAPSKPFLHRFGCLVFVGVPVVALVLYAAIDRWLFQRRQAEHALEQAAKENEQATLRKKTEEVVSAAKKAKGALEDAKKRCFAGVDAALDALPKKVKLIDMKAQKPVDAGALAGAGYVIMKHPSGAYIPIPTSKYFGKQACFAKVPEELDNAERYGAIGAFVAPETILDQAKALTELAAAMGAPAVIVATALDCPSARKKCAGTAVWMSTAEKKALAVVRVEKAVEDNGEKKDRDGLATLLENETNKW